VSGLLATKSMAAPATHTPPLPCGLDPPSRLRRLVCTSHHARLDASKTYILQYAPLAIHTYTVHTAPRIRPTTSTHIAHYPTIDRSPLSDHPPHPGHPSKHPPALPFATTASTWPGRHNGLRELGGGSGRVAPIGTRLPWIIPSIPLSSLPGTLKKMAW
jgi:hypothetical protein